ncbi:MAG: hypothetical protein D6B27_08090 [Gammaproteobacteria bacterium]|nr:MAG: hypothetical protein D6B27_08090 [Gammaproteobacteria bacterium]
MKSLIMLLTLLFSLLAAAEKADIWSESYKYEAAGKYSEAAALIEKNLNTVSDKEFANIRFAWLSYMLGNYDDSIRYYRKALSINSSSIDARLGITLPYLAKQECAKVTRYAGQVIEASPWNYTAHVRLMMCEQSRKQWATLKDHAQRISSRYPTDATILVYLARSYANLGKTDEAKKNYKRILIRYPGHIEAINYIANVN